MIGIYMITNKINNKRYIGQSIDIKNRWKQHIKKDRNTSIHNAIKKYGADNFKFEVLEECNKEALLEREQYYYNLYKPEYNQIIPIENPMNNPKIREKHLKAMKDENYRLKQSEISKESWNKRDESVKNKIVKATHTKKAQEKRVKTMRSEEFRQQHSEMMKRKWQDEEYRNQHVENKIEILKDIRQRPEVRKKYSINSKKRWENKEYRERVISQTSAKKRKKVIISKDGFQKEFESISHCAEWLSKKTKRNYHSCRTSISRIVNGKQKTVYKYSIVTK